MWDLINEKNADIINIRQIYPTQQEDVSRILKGILRTGKAKKVIIFGSSISCRCNVWSDIDVYCELTENFEFTEPYSECEVLPENSTDLWTNYMVDAALLKEINRTGVIVYEGSNTV